MKVNEFMRKVNYAKLTTPVYLIDIDSDETRKAVSWDFGNYYYDEKYYTLKRIDILPDRVNVYYKRSVYEYV